MLSGIKFDAPQASAASADQRHEDHHKSGREKESKKSHKKHSKSHKDAKSSKSHKSKKSSKDKKHSKDHKKHSKSSSQGDGDERHAKRQKLDETRRSTHEERSDDSSSESSSDEDENDQMTTGPSSHSPPSAHAASTLTRDSWMNPVVLTEAEKEAQRAKQRAIEERKESERREQDAIEEEKARVKAEGGLQGRHRPPAFNATPTAASAVTVADGGAGWRAKALKRARERAEEEGKSLLEVVGDRLGVDALLDAQRKNPATSQSSARPPSKFPAHRVDEDVSMTDAGLPSAFDGRKRHAREDDSTAMEIVETEEEQEAREGATTLDTTHQTAPALPHAHGRLAPPQRPQTELSRLMKRPALPTPTPSPQFDATSSAQPGPSTASSSSWRDKLKKNLVGTAVPRTPEGEVAKLYSTPSGAEMGRVQPSPSPLPTPSPSPTPLPRPSAASSEQRFAGMLGPKSLGMDRALDVVMEERDRPEQSPVQEGDVSLPEFAAAFLPITSAATPLPSQPPSTSRSIPPVPAGPTGASAAELNKLSAQAQVAKLKKNMPLYEDLQKKIVQMKHDIQQQQAASQVLTDATPSQHAQLHHQHTPPSIEEKLRLLQSEAAHRPTLDAHGHEIVVLHDAAGRPIQPKAAPTGPVRDVTMKNKKLAPNIDAATGERVAYFADDVKNTTLHELVAKEKMARQSAALGLNSNDRHDIDRDYAKSIMRDSTFKLADTDSQFDDADFNMSKFDLSTSVKNQKRSAQEHENRQRSQQIQQTHRQEAMIERCWYCLQGSKDIVKTLILSIGVRCYLAIPRVNWITPGHCCIIPIDHTLAQTHMEDDMYEEVTYFKKHLQKMYASFKPPQRCVFLETVYDLQKKRHTIIECIPISDELYQDAEIYMSKAINESDEEWAQNKKLISEKGGVRKAIPKNFSYFSIEFGVSDGGIAHTIEDTASFPENFGKEVLLGMMEESAQLYLRNKRAGATEEAKRVKEFQATWSKFDWTQKLAGGSRAPPPTQPSAPPAAAASSSAR